MIGMTVTYENNFKHLFDMLNRSSENAVDRTCAAIEIAAKRIVHVKSGDTRDSIHTELVSSGFRGYTKQVVATTPQSLWLEYGTVHQPPYPFMAPAAEEVNGTIDGIVAEAFAW